MGWRLRWAVLTACLVLDACAPTPPPPPELKLSPVSFDDLPGWREDDLALALPGLERSCSKPKHPSLVAGVQAGDWRAACAVLAAAPKEDAAGLRRALESAFQPYLATNHGEAKGLFTGYYEPELHGARTPSARFHVPLYSRPEDLVTVDLGEFRDSLKGQHIAGKVTTGKLKPYDSRDRIAAGALDGRHLELFWVDDAIEAFFLEIQGSGRVVLEDGSVQRVGYAATNGRPYVPIGRVLKAEGALGDGEVSMQTIRAWLTAHPDRAEAVMARNPSYVFFRLQGGDGPVGSEGVALTGGRSLAVDTAFVPLGVPVWLDTTYPPGHPRQGQPLRRLVVAQDTGGAIKGPVRGDLFWGAGVEAAEAAGRMQQEGRYFLLLPRAAGPGV